MPPPLEEVDYALGWLGCTCATKLVCGVCVGVLCEPLLDECGEVLGEAVHGEAHHVEVAAHTSTHRQKAQK